MLAQTTSEALSDADVVPLAEWNYDDIYATGVSAENFMDEMEVYGQDGDEIGDVEDILIGPDGQVIAVIAEVGGFWDIGDTHVSIPFDQVQVSENGEGVILPITEETVDEYGFFGDAEEPDIVAAETAESDVVAGVDDTPVRRAWRASELIGDYARLSEVEGRTDHGYMSDYGYVSDLILSDGQVSAVVVQPSATYGRGYRALPYYGYDAGWDAGSPYYDLPYTERQVGEAGEFDYERLGDS